MRFGISMVAAVLFLASTAPAFAQAVAIDEGDDVEYSAVCQNILGVGDISNRQIGTATATANGGNAGGEGGMGGNAEAVAEIAQEQGVSIEQVNECLNGATIGGGAGKEKDGEKTRAAETGAKTAAAQQYGVIVKSIPDQKVLANTGGLPLIGGAGVLLLASIAVGSMVIGRR